MNAQELIRRYARVFKDDKELMYMTEKQFIAALSEAIEGGHLRPVVSQPGRDEGHGGTLFAGVVTARKKPVEIEAIQCKEPNNIDDIMRFCPDAKQSDGGESGLVWVIIPTLEGDHQAKYEDWIIKGVQGEFYPCKPDIFDQTYNVVGANKVG